MYAVAMPSSQPAQSCIIWVSDACTQGVKGLGFTLQLTVSSGVVMS